MTSVKFIPAALRDLKQPKVKQFFDNIPTILAGMRLGTELAGSNQLNTIPLKGYKKRLFRTKIPGQEVRVIWQESPNGNGKTVIGIDARDEGTYGKDYDSLKDYPEYEWHEEKGNAWREWVYGGYKYAPVLTPDQERIGQEQKKHHHDSEFFARLIQSPPGTGKTITATVWADKYYQEGWNVFPIVPQLLIEETEKHLARRYDARDNTTRRLKPITFRDWLSYIQPQFKNRLADPERELESFRKVAQRTHKLKRLGEIGYRDILLYQAYVLDREAKNLRKSPLFNQNKDRINLLKSIEPKHWKRELGNNVLYRLEAAEQLGKNPPKPTEGKGTLIVIDEAQDYLLKELLAVIDMCQLWQKQYQHQTHLWLLGDLNQRIQPVDFEWGQLQLVKPIQPFQYNYRNSGQILKFANQFLKISQKNNRGRRKVKAEPALPECAADVGESVRLLVYESREALLEFFERLNQLSPLGENAQDRYLGVELAHQVKVLSSHLLQAEYQTSEAIEFLDVDRVKGREFDGSIALPTFTTCDIPLAEQAYRWYTLLTRTRTRLTIVTTEQEIERIEELVPNAFANCERIDRDCSTAVDSTIQWIVEAVGDTDASKRAVEIRDRLLQSLSTDPFHLYWDTYSLLETSKNDLNEWEQAAFFQLKERFDGDPDTLQFHTELDQIPDDCVSLKCLLLRFMHRSWDALETARSLQHSNQLEYKRIGESIATELKNKGLEYEAIRIQSTYDLDLPEDLPFIEIVDRPGELLSLVADTLHDRLADVIYRH